jgi:hypothetical protein
VILAQAEFERLEKYEGGAYMWVEVGVEMEMEMEGGQKGEGKKE